MGRPRITVNRHQAMGQQSQQSHKSDHHLASSFQALFYACCKSSFNLSKNPYNVRTMKISILQMQKLRHWLSITLLEVIQLVSQDGESSGWAREQPPGVKLKHTGPVSVGFIVWVRTTTPGTPHHGFQVRPRTTNLRTSSGNARHKTHRLPLRIGRGRGHLRRATAI